jgi:hypothetical protein
MKPQFPADQDMSDVSPQDVKDAKDRAKATKAYDKAMPKKYAKGGMVRGDGCAQRGKTKGRMV